MNVIRDIAVIVERLHLAEVPIDHLCYELDEDEWNDLAACMARTAPGLYRDLNYAEDCVCMGLHVRRRRKEPKW